MDNDLKPVPADPEVPWDLVAFVRRSWAKAQIISLLGEEPLAATEIGDVTDLETGTVSNYFRELKQTDPPLIHCITPDQPHHRLYDLTETGETVREYIPES